jgi:hypothetical protein
VLLDPAGAVAAIRPEGGLRAAETALLGQEPKTALELLRGLESSDPRVTRLRLDAHVALEDGAAARELAAKLADDPGWRVHARRALRQLDEESRGRWFGTFGALLFALSTTLLLLGGARELLRPRVETLLLLIASAIGSAGIGSASALLGPISGLLFFAWSSTLHAALAARRRQEPGPRGRVLLAALSLLAIGGATVAILSPLPGSMVAMAF